MRYKVLVIMSLFFLVSINLKAQSGDKLLGKYHLPNNLDIEIFKVENNGYSGKIIALNGFDKGQKLDVNNKDRSKRKDPLLGKVIITNLKYNEKNNNWTNGKMYGPKKGMNFKLKVNKVDEDEIEVVGSKYFFWKTMQWKKIQS